MRPAGLIYPFSRARRLPSCGFEAFTIPTNYAALARKRARTKAQTRTVGKQGDRAFNASVLNETGNHAGTAGTLRSMASTTGLLVRSLEAILHELTMMEDALRDAGNQVNESDRRQLRRDVHELRARAEALIEWLSNERLEEPKN